MIKLDDRQVYQGEIDVLGDDFKSFFGSFNTTKEDLFCTSCGYMGKAKRVKRGSIFITIVLLICFFIPGLIYSIWRSTNKITICLQCKKDTVIPATSPVAQKMLHEYSK